MHNENTSFVMNIMLQHLENTESLTSTRAPQELSGTPAYKVSRDRSICACMKDYATPYFIKEHKEGSVDDPESTDTYDTCLAQNLQDSTFNAPDSLWWTNGLKEEKDGTTWTAGDWADARYGVTFASRMEGKSPVQRNRKDPVSYMIETYFNMIADANADDPSDTSQTARDAKLQTLNMHNETNEYHAQSFMNLVNTLITSTVWDHNDNWDDSAADLQADLTTYLPGYSKIRTNIETAIYEPFAEIELNNNVPQAVNWETSTVTLHDLREFLLQYTKHMYAHNKHVRPNIDMEKDIKKVNTPDHLHTTAAKNPPELTPREFQQYTKKYLSMFKMCSEQAVGSYSLDATQRTNTRLFVQMAETLLLYAVWFGG